MEILSNEQLIVHEPNTDFKPYPFDMSEISLIKNNLVADFNLDNIRVERKVVEMVRGDTYVPKKSFCLCQSI